MISFREADILDRINDGVEVVFQASLASMKNGYTRVSIHPPNMYGSQDAIEKLQKCIDLAAMSHDDYKKSDRVNDTYRSMIFESFPVALDNLREVVRQIESNSSIISIEEKSLGPGFYEYTALVRL